MYTRATDSKSTLFLMCARTLNRQRLSNTRTLTPATLQASGKASSKAKALRLLRTNSSKAKFDEHIALFKQRLQHRGYPDNLLNMTLSEVNFSQRMSALQNKQKTRKRILPFVTEYRPSMPDLKHILMNKWHLIQNQPLLQKNIQKPSPYFI